MYNIIFMDKKLKTNQIKLQQICEICHCYLNNQFDDTELAIYRKLSVRPFGTSRARRRQTDWTALKLLVTQPADQSLVYAYRTPHIIDTRLLISYYVTPARRLTCAHRDGTDRNPSVKSLQKLLKRTSRPGEKSKEKECLPNCHARQLIVS